MEENNKSVRNYNEQKKIEPIVKSDEVKVKEKGIGKKLADIFLSEDISKVGSYLFTDVVIPAIKDTIVDIVKNGIDMLFYGESRADSRKGTGGTYVSYSNYYSASPKSRKSDADRRDRGRVDIRELIFVSRGKAQEAIDSLKEYIELYQTASVADLYSLVGITGDWNDNKWGWYDLNGVKPRRVHGGYILDLPKPIYLE